ncbi:MAG: ABC transporter permease subunit [Hyphomicrobiales bacterium]|nr:ABC transporter permease subunit [Hyphomicrobiales bacterium]
MSCADTLTDYALRSIGIGARLLPKADITICEQVVLIGSGVIWNIYYGLLAIVTGFFFATVLAVARASERPVVSKPAEWFIFIFRGSPLFIQFFFAYELFVLLPKLDIEIPLGFTTIVAETRWLTKAWLGALIVLFLNTSAYSAEIFHGALKAVPKGDIEAADAYGMGGFTKFRRIIWPTLLRLAWPSYTNEAIFLFHATTLVFLSSFPAWKQKGDALYYASYLAEKTFNPFVAYPIVAGYFILLTLIIILIFSLFNRRLNRHLDLENRSKIKYRPQIMLAR